MHLDIQTGGTMGEVATGWQDRGEQAGSVNLNPDAPNRDNCVLTNEP